MNKLILSLFFLLITVSVEAATYYIRDDGGTRTQCTGLADAAYPGSGTAQACAWSQFRYAFTDTTSGNFAWVISGGDTILVKGGPHRIGYQGPNSGDHGGPNPGDPYANAMPPIPSGTINNHTKILGENYANCTAKTEINAGYGANSAINVIGSDYVDIQCIEVTDHGQCGMIGSTNACVSSYPLDDYAKNGVVSGTGTSDIYFKDFSAHGFASRGWLGHIEGNVTLEDSYIGYNPGAGIDLDDGTPSTGGTFKLLKTTLEWNGCIEEYPITSAIPAYRCFDQSSSGYGDAIGTVEGDQASWDIDQSLFRYNTQDGADILHSVGSGTIKITRSSFYGNMGQQIKMGATLNSTIQNNFIVHNCNRLSAAMTGATAGFNTSLSNFCRAGGDGIVVDFSGTGNARVEHNTYVGYGDTSIDVNCRDAGTCGAGGTKTLRNNIFIGVSNPNWGAGGLPGFLYYSDPSTEAMWTLRDHNYVYNHKNYTPKPTESASNPGIAGPITMTNESDLDGISLILTVSSAVKDLASTIADLVLDYFGNDRPEGTGPDIGAHEYGATGGAVCDGSHLSLCLTQSPCESAGGYWYNSSCNSSAQSSGTRYRFRYTE